MIGRKEGVYTLTPGGAATKAGTWSYQAEDSVSGIVSADGCQVGLFSYAPIAGQDVFKGVFQWRQELQATRPMRCIGVVNGEVMKNIQDPASVGAYFVLPSQLNGAEYPSEVDIVQDIADYVYDNTGGPRGQLAVHPAAGQFVLSNAASDHNATGLSAVDQILNAVPQLALKNGYMALPSCADVAAGERLFDDLARALHTLRPLMMHNVPAAGLTDSKRDWSQASHCVSLAYASAVPVDAYLNRATSEVEAKLHRKIAEAILVAQYYGAIKEAAQRTPAGKKTKVFLLPLGGGVFNNPVPSIVRAMCQAMELLAEMPELFDAVEVDALAWSGNPSELTNLTRELQSHNKYIDRSAVFAPVPLPRATAEDIDRGTVRAPAPLPPVAAERRAELVALFMQDLAGVKNSLSELGSVQADLRNDTKAVLQAYQTSGRTGR